MSAKGRFDGVNLGGADIFWLAARTSAGTNEMKRVAAFAEEIRYGDIDDVSMLHLEGAYCPGAHLEGAFLREAHLEGTELEDAYLQGAYLVGTHLDGASFHGAHLKGATVIETYLRGAHLEMANLKNARLYNALLQGAILDRAHMEGADLKWVHMEGASLRESHLTGADLACADLMGANLGVAHMENVNLREAHLEGVCLLGAHLEGSTLSDAHLEGRRLTTEEVVHIRPWAPDLPDALPPADMRLAYFDSSTLLSDVNLGAVSLADVRWGDVNLAVVDWTRTQPGFLGIRKRIEAIELGDEREAREARDSDGKPKDKARRLQEFKDAVRANRQLATALRNQGLNEDADRFAYKAQKLQREVLRRQGNFGGYAFSLLLWALSGYGYRLWRIAAAYGIVLLTFTVIFLALGVHSHSGEPGIQALWDSFLVSLSAIHGRTMFEQLGAWSPAAWFAAVESVVGIVIEGVFVAMLIQRFFGR